MPAALVAVTQRAALRGAVAAALALLLWLGWQAVRPPERVGDVPYVATRPPVVDRMLELAEIGPEDLLFDLGSGDGRIVLRAAARFGARARGYELDPLLVAESRAAAARAGLAERVEFVVGDLFDAPLGEATAVTLFLLPTVNRALRPRLLADLAPGVPVVSHMWDMAEWLPDAHQVVPLEPPADVYLWIVPARLGGVWEVRWGGLDAPAPGETATLRLMQRFQELEGELLYAGDGVPVAGVVAGTRAEVATVRPHPRLGDVALVGALGDGALAGEMVHQGSTAGVPFTASRRPARVDGVWEVAAAGAPSRPAWAVRLWRRGADWQAERWRLVGEGGVPLPGSPPAGTAPASATPLAEVYVWGGSIAFFVPAADDPARRVGYWGLIDGDRVAGVTQDGTTLVPWVARRRLP